MPTSPDASRRKAPRAPRDFFAAPPAYNNLFDDWGISSEELSHVLSDNPSLRGMVLGYIAEAKLREVHLSDKAIITGLVKYDDHDRSKKSDFVATYKGLEISIESKLVDNPSVTTDGATASGTFQCNASDKREVMLSDGQMIQTNNLLVGEFDVMAVALHPFGFGWQFAFALNEQLPRSRYRRYPAEIREQLLASSMKITWPLVAPYSSDLYQILDRVVERKAAERQSPSSTDPVVLKEISAPAELIHVPKSVKLRRP